MLFDEQPEFRNFEYFLPHDDINYIILHGYMEGKRYTDSERISTHHDTKQKITLRMNIVFEESKVALEWENN